MVLYGATLTVRGNSLPRISVSTPKGKRGNYMRMIRQSQARTSMMSGMLTAMWGMVWMWTVKG